MRKTLWAVACLLISAACFGSGNYKPMNVKTGLWEVTLHTTVKGLPPSMAALADHTHSYKTCVTPENLKENPFSDQKCDWTVIQSTPTDMEAKGTSCKTDQSTAGTAHYKLHAVDSQHVNGSGEWTGLVQGQNMSGTADGSGHWVGASCGDVK